MPFSRYPGLPETDWEVLCDGAVGAAVAVAAGTTSETAARTPVAILVGCMSATLGA